MSSLHFVLAAFAVGAVTIVGCGTSDESTFGDGNGDGTSGGPGSSGGTLGGASSSSGAGASGGTSSSGGVGNVGNVSANDACATSNAGAALAPVSLVFMIDRSGSMGNSKAAGNNLTVRWEPVKSGLTAFLGDAATSNIEASLAFFPIVNGNGDSQCTVGDYATPVVAMTKLPNATPFSTAFSNTGPGGGTPTEPALSGALQYAGTVKGQGKNVAIVLATDGQPNDCSSDVNGVASIAAGGVKDGIKTYVIGVGPSTGNLNTIAQSGGTKEAIMIPTNDPSQVSADLKNAVGNIASSLLGCSYGLPAPPSGQTLDLNKVNVNYTPPGAATQTLAYSGDCSNKGGWHYDSTTAPSQIILCDDACNTAKSAAGAKLDVIFGCSIAAAPGTELPGPK